MIGFPIIKFYGGGFLNEPIKTYRGVKIIAEIGRPGACDKNMSLQRMFHLRHNAQSNGPMSVRET